jgi:hypothetical protein
MFHAKAQRKTESRKENFVMDFIAPFFASLRLCAKRFFASSEAA